eukprot:m.327667 g.327667  ORF g.327667 m.327667 type:complete len:565 (-) comp20420_c0_seq3:188-1882(-)
MQLLRTLRRMTHVRQSDSAGKHRGTPQQQFMQLFVRPSKRQRKLDNEGETCATDIKHLDTKHSTNTSNAQHCAVKEVTSKPKIVPAIQSGNPRTIVSWNVNGLKGRIESNSRAIKDFLDNNCVDVLFLSEVRAKASKHSQAKLSDGMKLNSPEAKEKRLIESALERGGCFEGYRAWFSLAQKKYAGTAMLVRRGTHMPISVEYDLPSLNSESSTSGSGAMHTNVAPKKKVHNPEGRIILAEWADMFILHTYTPNNGSKPDNYRRRNMWDMRITDWFEQRAIMRQKYLQLQSNDSGHLSAFDSHSIKDIMYVGDLNVAPSDCDLSHPAFFKSQMPTTDGNTKNSGQAGCTPAEQERFSAMLLRGSLVDAYRHVQRRETEKDQLGSSSSSVQLGAPNEPNPSVAPQAVHDGMPAPSAASAVDVSQPLYTWRGRPGVDIAHAGRFYGRGMRIDHCLVSHHPLSDNMGSPVDAATGKEARVVSDTLPDASLEESVALDSKTTSGKVASRFHGGTLLDAVQSVTIHGRGLSCNDDSFLGSDHCPVGVILDKHWNPSHARHTPVETTKST